MNAFQRDRREGEATFTSMGTALFHAKREARMIHDSFVVTARHFVISQTTLLAHGVLVLAALGRTCKAQEEDKKSASSIHYAPNSAALGR